MPCHTKHRPGLSVIVDGGIILYCIELYSLILMLWSKGKHLAWDFMSRALLSIWVFY